jgi:fructosamine-3-kinase
MNLPPPLQDALTQTLGAPLSDIHPISKGTCSAAARFTAGNQNYLVKWSTHQYQSPPGWPDPLTAEANHLNLFGESYSIQIDQILRRYVG